MIKEPFIFLGICIISLGLSSFLLSDRAGVFKTIALRLFFIGIIFHEIAHYLMSLAVGKIPEKISIKWRNEKYKFIRDPHGSVKPADPPSFLQAIVIALGPLYISTWLIFFLLFGVISIPLYNPVIKTIAVFLVFSLLLTASPSSGDIGAIATAFKEDPQHSWYSIFLIILSFLTLWFFLLSTQIIFFLDVFYYLAITGIYLIYKFSFIGIRKIIIRINSRIYNKPNKVRFKRFSRTHYKPKKPWKE
jgi:hypothetical protein